MTAPPSDPYAFLEDAADARTVAWTAQQNARTRRAFDALPQRAALQARLSELLCVDVLSVPVVRAGRAFYTARRGDAEQASLFVRERGIDRVLLDPATLDGSGLVALDWWYPNAAGTRVAIGLSRDGSERSTLDVVDVATGKRSTEAIPDTRYCSLAWYADGSGFFYTRYPPGGDYDVRAYGHTLGAPWREDRLVFGAGRKSEEMLSLALSPGGRFLVVNVHDGWARSDAYVADTDSSPLRFETIAENRPALYDVEPSDDALYVRTNENAPRFRLFRVDPQRLAREHWSEIVPQSAGSLDAFAVAGETLILHYLENVRSVVRIRRAGGQIETPAGFCGRSLLGLTADAATGDAYVLHASFLDPPEIAHLRIGASQTSIATWERVAAPFDASAYRVDQRWYASKDGTHVPMYVIARNDVPRDGTAPAVLYGYGGFNVSLVPAFAPNLVPWLDAGGVYAVANVRGGGEFGEDWHRAGMRENKQNVFDDFIAAAEYLGTSAIADRERIAIMGGSNGGLLVAAVATQRPGLVRAVVCLVPLTDMLRFHEFLIARLWIAEYGDPDVAGDAAILRAYSPFHAVRDGVAYPAMLVFTAASDGRVDPMHARKFGARVQAATAGDAPIYVYVEQHAGHGVGKPRHKVVAELADRWGFLGAQLGVSWGV